MSGVILFTDLHAHNFPDCSKIISSGINSRLLDCAEIIKQVATAVEEKGAKAVVFGGDLFHIPGKREDSVNNVTLAALSMLGSLVPVYMIPGNHDQADRQGDNHALENLKYISGIRVIDKEPTPIDIVGFKFCLAPYRREPDDIKRQIEKAHEINAEINIFHQGLGGVPIGKGNVVIDEVLGINDLPTSSKWNLLGHYHETKFVNDQTIFLGSPLQHNWGDEGVEKWIWHLKDSGELEAIPTKAPKFIKVHYEGQNNLGLHPQAEEFEGNFVALAVQEGLTQKTKDSLQDELFSMGALYAKVHDIDGEDTEVSEVVMDTPLLTNPREAVIEYLDDVPTAGLDKEELTKIGVGFLQ